MTRGSQEGQRAHWKEMSIIRCKKSCHQYAHLIQMCDRVLVLVNCISGGSHTQLLRGTSKEELACSTVQELSMRVGCSVDLSPILPTKYAHANATVQVSSISAWCL